MSQPPLDLGAELYPVFKKTFALAVNLNIFFQFLLFRLLSKMTDKELIFQK